MISTATRIIAAVLLLLCSPASAAIYDWSNTCFIWHFNPNDVRDPTIIFNNTSDPINNVSGYSGTEYAFTPINFPPQSALAMCSDGSGPKPFCANTWTQITLSQFGISVTAKEVILTINSGFLGPHMWTNVAYAWFRAPGSSWALSPIYDGGYYSDGAVHVPVGLVNGVPTIEAAWRINGTMATGDDAWLNAILTGWCE
jgi:hypothetical protein